MSLDEMPRRNVTSYTFRNVYVYSAIRLWVAYGVAILLTGVAALVGLVTILSTGASFSNTFSSVMRSSWNAGLDVDIRPEDAINRDPLPKRLANATFTLPERNLSWNTSSGIAVDDDTTRPLR